MNQLFPYFGFAKETLIGGGVADHSDRREFHRYEFPVRADSFISLANCSRTYRLYNFVTVNKIVLFVHRSKSQKHAPIDFRGI